MCRSLAEGGRRCPGDGLTKKWRTLIRERLARNIRVGNLDALVARDRALLATIDTAIERWGLHVQPHHIDLPTDAVRLVDRLRSDGMTAVLVGGSVRDSFDGRTPKDLDFEVYHATVDDVAVSARKLGKVDEVGKAFGVLKMTLPDGTDIDLSVPRRENKVGAGHRGFEVSTDAGMTIEEASARRDFTINTLSYDPELGVLIDPHGGKGDLDNKVLRHVSDAFDEDPLRVMRGMQFASRFGMRMAPETAERCRSLMGEAATLPVERMRTEWEKWATKSRKPSAGLDVLRQTGWSDVIAGAAGLGADDNRRVDAMRRVLDRHPQADAAVMMPATLAVSMSDADARKFLNQAIEGTKGQTKAFHLSRSSVPQRDDASLREAARGPVTLREVAVFHNDDRLLAKAETLGIADGPEPDWASGDDILATTGRKPGPWVGEVVSRLRQAQARRVFHDRESALAWLRNEV